MAWAAAVPWSIRGYYNLPLATWAVLGMIISRAGERGAGRAELNLSEMQRGLGGASRHTVTAAVKRLVHRGFVRVIRRRRTPQCIGSNVYVLEGAAARRAPSNDETGNIRAAPPRLASSPRPASSLRPASLLD